MLTEALLTRKFEEPVKETSFSQLVIQDNLERRLALSEAEEIQPLAAIPGIKNWVVKDIVTSLQGREQLFETTFSEILEKWEEGHLSVEDHDYEKLVAVIFNIVRGSLPKERLFRSDQQNQQIEAVCNLLKGESSQVDKGVGKSKVALPVYALTMALLDHIPNQLAVCLVASDASQAKVLYQDTQRTIDAFGEAIQNLPENFLSRRRKLALKERLDLSLNCRLEQSEPNSSSSPLEVNLLRQSQTAGAKIAVMTHSEYIFATLEDRENWFRFPPVVFDEWPLARESSYIETITPSEQDTQEFDGSNPDHRNTLSKYVVMRLLQTFTSGQDFNYTEGQVSLNMEGQKRTTALAWQLSSLLRNRKSLSGSLEGLSSEEALLLNRLREIMQQEILPQIKLGPNPARTLWRNLRTYFSGVLDAPLVTTETGIGIPSSENSTNQAYWIQLLTEEFAQYSNLLREGRDYLWKEDNPVVRHGVLGVEESDKRFNFSTYFNLANKYSALRLPREEQISHSLDYPTWVKFVMGGRVLGLSGALFQINRRTGKYELTPFGQEMEWATGSRIRNVSTESPMIALPEPHIFRDQGSMEKSLEGLMKTLKKANLLVCWDEHQAEALSRSLSRYGKKVGVIYAGTSLEDESRLITDFTTGEISILISTGRGSYGLDINTPEGKPFDFGVTVVNPETAFQLEQALTRRRLDRDPENFQVYFDRPTLLKLASYLDETSRPEYLVAGYREASVKEFVACIDYLSMCDLRAVEEFGLTDKQQVAARFNETINILLSRHEKRRLQVDLKTFDLQGKFVRHLEPYLRERKRGLLTEIFHHSPQYQSLLEIRFKQLAGELSGGTVFSLGKTEVLGFTKNVLNPKLAQNLRLRLEEVVLQQFSQLEDTIWDDLSEVAHEVQLTEPQISKSPDTYFNYVASLLIDKAKVGNEYYEQWQKYFSSDRFVSLVTKTIEKFFSETRSDLLALKEAMIKEGEDISEVFFYDKPILPQTARTIPGGAVLEFGPRAPSKNNPATFSLIAYEGGKPISRELPLNKRQAILMIDHLRRREITIANKPIIFSRPDWFLIEGRLDTTSTLSLCQTDLEARIAYLNKLQLTPVNPFILPIDEQIIRAWKT